MVPSAPVVTAVVVSEAAALTPTTPPVVLAPSAPNTSGVPSVSTLPVDVEPAFKISVLGLATGTSSVTVTVTVFVVALPNWSYVVILIERVLLAPDTVGALVSV